MLCTVNDFLTALEEEDATDDAIALVIEPPDPREETDEESGDEDDKDPCHLTRHQLQAPAHLIRSRDGEREEEHLDAVSGSSSTENTSVEETSAPTARTRRGRSRATEIARQEKPQFEKPVYTFKKAKSLISSGLPIFPAGDYSKYRHLFPCDLMELFWSDDLFDFIKLQITGYCQFKNKADINVTVDELKVYLGILLVSGYACFPQRWMYWSHQPDLGSTAVSDSMRKNRFEQISQFLHFADNTKNDAKDKYYKLRPLISHLQSKFMDHFVPAQNISHDEALVEYFGKNSLKQHIIQKPIRFGYKIWCLNTPEGYLIAFDPYQGKCGQYDEELAKIWGKSSSTVLRLLGQSPDGKKEFPFHITFDNLLTSFDLLDLIRAETEGL